MQWQTVLTAMSESTYCNAWPSGDSNTTDFWSGESWRRCGLASPTCTPSCKGRRQNTELYMRHNIFFFLEQNKFLYFKSAHFKQVRKYIHMITQLPATDQHHFLLSLCASVHFWTNIWKSIKPINLIFRGNSSSDPGKTWLYFEKNCP